MHSESDRQCASGGRRWVPVRVSFWEYFQLKERSVWFIGFPVVLLSLDLLFLKGADERTSKTMEKFYKNLSEPRF